jgi:hypothetical protein
MVGTILASGRNRRGVSDSKVDDQNEFKVVGNTTKNHFRPSEIEGAQSKWT